MSGKKTRSHKHTHSQGHPMIVTQTTQHRIFQPSTAHISSSDLQTMSTINYNSTVKCPSDVDPLGSLSPHFSDQIGIHFAVVDKSSIPGLAIGSFPPLKGMLITYWPEILRSDGTLPHWWIKAVSTIENLVLRFNNVPMKGEILEALLMHSPKLTNLTLEVDLFSEDLFPQCCHTTPATISRRANVAKAFQQLKSLTLVNLSVFFCSRSMMTSMGPNCKLRNLSNNIFTLQDMSAGILEALTIRNTVDEGNYLYETAFNEEYIVPFILKNLKTLKYLDLYNTLLQPKHLKKIIRHSDFKKLRLTSLIIDLRFENLVPPHMHPDGPCSADLVKIIEPNFPDVIRVLKSQGTMTALFLRTDFLDKSGLRKILGCVPNLERLCLQQVDVRKEMPQKQVDLVNIFPQFSPALKVLKFICVPQRSMLDPLDMRNIDLQPYSIAGEIFVQNLPEELISLNLTNVFVTNSRCFELLIGRCPNLTSLTLKCNHAVFGNTEFRKIVQGLTKIKYLEVMKSIIGDAGLVEEFRPGHPYRNQFNTCFSQNLRKKIPKGIKPVYNSILNSLEFLEEVKLISCPYITNAGFRSIKHPKLTKIDVSSNVMVDGEVLVDFVQFNPALKYIVVSHCPLVELTAVGSIVKTAKNAGREIAFEVDHSLLDTGSNSFVKHCRYDDQNGEDSAFVVEEFYHLLNKQNLSTATKVEDAESGDEDDFIGFNRMMKRMKIREEIMVEEALVKSAVMCNSPLTFSDMSAAEVVELMKSIYKTPGMKMGSFGVDMKEGGDKCCPAGCPCEGLPPTFSDKSVQTSFDDVNSFCCEGCCDVDNVFPRDAVFVVQSRYNWTAENPFKSGKIRRAQRSKSI